MSIEEGGLTDLFIEDANEAADFENCPCCERSNWLRAIAAYTRGACWVIYCGDCGRAFEERWNIAP